MRNREHEGLLGGKGKRKGKKDGKRGKIEVGLTQKRYRKGIVGGIKNTINDDERGKERKLRSRERKSVAVEKRKLRWSRGEDGGVPTGPFLFGPDSPLSISVLEMIFT